MMVQQSQPKPTQVQQMQIDTYSAAKKKEPREVPEITLFKDDIAKSKALVGETIIKGCPVSSEHA